MKPQMKYLTIYAAALVALASCAVLPGNDPVVVNAEKTTAIAYDTMEAFKTYEYNNRATLEQLNPQIEHYANVIRRNEKQWLQTARDETTAYENNRTNGHATLDTAIDVLREAIRQIGIYMAQAKGTH